MNAPLTPIPPLENGDRLTREEFERRYHAMPHVKKAELIEGIVFMPSPVRAEGHGNQHAKMTVLLGNYAAETPGVEVSNDATVRLDPKNEPQPDVILYIEHAYGGRSVIDSDGYLAGGPELAVEIAGSTASLDLGHKKRVYRRHGIQEYVVWNVFDEVIDWFVLRGLKYCPLAADMAKVVRSQQFPGLWLDVRALLLNDMSQANATLRRGLESAEHAAFLAKLRAAKSPR